MCLFTRTQPTTRAACGVPHHFPDYDNSDDDDDVRDGMSTEQSSGQPAGFP